VYVSRRRKSVFPNLSLGEVKEIFSSEAVDIFAVNLESPFGEVNQVPFTENPDMNLCADMDAVNILLQGGIDLVTTANNHSSDCPAEAIHPAQALESAGIQSLGRDDEPLLIPAGEQSVAFIAVDDSTGTFDHDALMEKFGQPGSRVILWLSRSIGETNTRLDPAKSRRNWRKNWSTLVWMLSGGIIRMCCSAWNGGNRRWMVTGRW